MTVKQLSIALSLLKEELQDKEVVIRAKNGLLLRADVRFILNNPQGDITSKNVKYVILAV